VVGGEQQAGIAGAAVRLDRGVGELDRMGVPVVGGPLDDLGVGRRGFR
jgi:hypothetical protein